MRGSGRRESVEESGVGDDCVWLEFVTPEERGVAGVTNLVK